MRTWVWGRMRSPIGGEGVAIVAGSRGGSGGGGFFLVGEMIFTGGGFRISLYRMPRALSGICRAMAPASSGWVLNPGVWGQGEGLDQRYWYNSQPWVGGVRLLGVSMSYIGDDGDADEMKGAVVYRNTRVCTATFQCTRSLICAGAVNKGVIEHDSSTAPPPRR